MSSLKKDSFITFFVIAIFIVLSCFLMLYGRVISIPVINKADSKSSSSVAISSSSVSLTDSEKSQLSARLEKIRGYLKLPELRIVSPKFPLYEGYTSTFKALPSKYSNFPDKERLVDERCYDAFIGLLEGARNSNIKVYLYSTFRSFADQKKLYDDKIQSNIKKGLTSEGAKSETAKTVAAPGTSEHQYGYSADIGDGKEYEFNALRKTETYGWLKDNAHIYGFILRYPDGTSATTGMGDEPWHFRYIGVEHAQYVYENNLTLEDYITELQKEEREITAKLNIKK